MATVSCPFNLEEVTHLVAQRHRYRALPEDPHISVKVIDYGDGVFKVATSVLGRAPGRTNVRKVDVGTDRADMQRDVLARSARRAQQTLRDTIIATRANRMLTFTARGGLTRDELIDCVRDWCASMRAIGFDLPMIMVPELHLGDGENHGTYHGHAAVRWPEFIDFKVTRAAWIQALRKNVARFADRQEESLGSLNVGKEASAPLSLARYLSKYLVKDFELGTAHKKRFICYGPIKRATKSVICDHVSRMPPLPDILAAAMELTGADRGHHVDTTYSQVWLVDNVYDRTGPKARPAPAGVDAPSAPSPAYVLAAAALSSRGSGKPPAEDAGRNLVFDGYCEDYGRQLLYLAEPSGSVTHDEGVRQEVMADEHFLSLDDD